MKDGEEFEGKVEYVNKTRDFYNHIAIRFDPGSIQKLRKMNIMNLLI